MLWIPLLVFVSVLVISLGGMILIVSTRTEKGEIRKRLSLVRIRSLRDGDIPDFLKSMVLSEVPLLNRILKESRLAVLIDKRLKQGDLSIKVGTFILLSLAFFGVGSLIGFFLKWHVVLTVLVASLLCSAPYFVVGYRTRRRLKMFTAQFPDTLEMFSRSLRAGHSFIGAIQLVAQEMPAPVGPEFQKIFDEQNLGIPLRQALIDLTERVDSLDVKFFITALLIQRDTGGNLAEIIDKISYVIRERFRVQGQLRIFTAQARLSGMILALLPPLIALAIYFLNPEYLKPLWFDKLGNFMVGMAVVLQIAGMLVIRKIVRIKI
jgi:tight adherence protein B